MPSKSAPGKDAIHVTMHIVSRKGVAELKANEHAIKQHAETAFKAIMQPIESGDKIAERLSLPKRVPVTWNVEIAAMKEGVQKHADRIPIMVSVAGVPNIMERLKPEVVHEVTNTIFGEVRNQAASLELAKALGYATDKPAKFHLFLPHQVRPRGPTGPTAGDGDGDGDGGGDSGPPVWVQGGWSKGCSSWPW